MTRRAAVLFVILTLLVACDGDQRRDAGPRRTPVQAPTGAGTRVIGLVGTLTGLEGERGNEAFEGADVGVAVLNRMLNRGERPYELVTTDDGGDPSAALELVSDLALSERTVGIVYAGPPQALPQAEEALAAAGIPAILCFGDLYGARRLTPHIFQASPSLVWEARRLTAYLLKDRRYARIGMFVESSPTGSTARRALLEAVAARRGRAPIVVHYRPGAQAFEAGLRRLKRARVEAIVLQGSPGALARAASTLEAMGAAYRTTASARIASARPRLARSRRRSSWWHPQLASFDSAVAPSFTGPPGTVAAESYARGAHYLPIPTFEEFSRAYRRWWDAAPVDRQLRAYDAVRMIGWAARRSRSGQDRAGVLERLRGERFGGLDITLGPDDHTVVDATTVGLWTVPRPGVTVPERGKTGALRWVPLARGFSIDGKTLDILPRDWRYLVRKAPPPRAPAPRFTRLRFGVRTKRSDPVH